MNVTWNNDKQRAVALRYPCYQVYLTTRDRPLLIKLPLRLRTEAYGWNGETRTLNLRLIRPVLSPAELHSMVVADRIELSLTAYQTVFLPLEDATFLGGNTGVKPIPAGPQTAVLPLHQ